MLPWQGQLFKIYCAQRILLTLSRVSSSIRICIYIYLRLRVSVSLQHNAKTAQNKTQPPRYGNTNNNKNHKIAKQRPMTGPHRTNK